jgi:4-amino-4-deoxy-L-arabinose transferase-like glycosyltransferase
LAGLTVLLACTLRAPSLFEPHWYGDEGIFASIAHDIRHGRALYRDAWDLKPPLIFWTYAAVQQVAGTGMFPIRLAGLGALIATQLTVMASAARIAGPGRSWAAGLVLAVLLGSPRFEGNLALTETFMVVPVSLAMLALVSAAGRSDAARLRLYAAAGVLIGIGMNYKQVAAWDGAAFGLFLLVTERRWRTFFPIWCAGVALPHLLVGGWFLANGAFADYWSAVAGVLPRYAGWAPDYGRVHSAGRFVPAVAVTLLYGARRLRGAKPGLESLGPIWLAFAFAGATSSGFGFPHYLQQMVPPLALTLATLPRFQLGRREAGRVALACSLVAVALSIGYRQFKTTFAESQHNRLLHYYEDALRRAGGTMSEEDYALRFDGTAVTVERIAAAIRKDEPPADARLFAWGDIPWVYALSGVPNASRYYTGYHILGTPGAQAELLATLDADPPTYLVLVDYPYDPINEVSALAGREYELLDAGGDWRLFRLRTSRAGRP